MEPNESGWDAAERQRWDEEQALLAADPGWTDFLDSLETRTKAEEYFDDYDDCD